MDTIHGLIENYLEKEDKTVLVKILELLKTEEKLYTVLVRATNNFYMGIEHEMPCAYLFTSREYADNFARETRWEGIQSKYLEIKPEQRISFFSDLYRSGIEAVAIDKGENSLVMSLYGIIDKPSEEDAALMNPSLVRAANQFYQELARKKAIKPMQDLMCFEIHKATYLVPTRAVEEKEGRHIHEKGDKTEFAVLGTQDGKKYLPVFSDWSEFSRYDKKVNHDAVLLQYADLKKVIRKFDGIALNPLGFNLILDQEKMGSIEALVSAQGDKVISLKDRREK